MRKLILPFMSLVLILAAKAGGAATLTPAEQLAATGIVAINFQPANVPPPKGMLPSAGEAYSPTRGYGWDPALVSASRRRNIEPDLERDTLVALLDRGVSRSTFRVDLPDGDYYAELLIGDPAYDIGCAVYLEPDTYPGFECHLAPSEFKVVPLALTVRDAAVRITIVGGEQGIRNASLCSLRIYRRDDKREERNKARSAWQAEQQRRTAAEKERTERKAQNRAAYKPLVIRPEPGAGRQTVSLHGDWLFIPTEEIKSESDPRSPALADNDWHVLPVPNLWNPISWWIYNGENGVSPRFDREEKERCTRYTFDALRATSGWYRQWIELPAELEGKRLTLRFSGAASVAEVHWNGERVGGHVGMFGPFTCDVTKSARLGKPNLLTVFVSSGAEYKGPGKAEDVLATAVTVNITREMLASLPHGSYRVGLAGLWKPVRLEITGPTRIEDVFFQPRLDGATIQTTLTSPATVSHRIIDPKSGSILWQGQVTGEGAVSVSASGLEPKLWSPEEPNLYQLVTTAMVDGRTSDELTTIVGFRTFEVKGTKFYLNGLPYFLRGANMPPHGLRQNDAVLAKKFMRFMHEGNQMFTRWHTTPSGEAWLDAADTEGVGGSVEGIWPWMLIGPSPLPDPALTDHWKREHLEVVRALRNHPSVLMWTMSNESYFEGRRDPDRERRLAKFKIFSDAIKATRALDPTRPIVFHSGYVRSAEEFDRDLRPLKLDDGDADDRHDYHGWYAPSAVFFDVQRDFESKTTGTRPLISQEASTGYPDNDTGHPTGFYTALHYVPQAWVGQYAQKDQDPSVFLQTHALITKEMAEKVRRDRRLTAGWLLFANCCWFQDAWDAERIKPYPTYDAVRTALQPVLVSLDSPTRHFAAGGAWKCRVCVANDGPSGLPLRNLRLDWQTSPAESSGQAAIPDVPHDSRVWQEITFNLSNRLPSPRSESSLALALRSANEVVSTNKYSITVAEPNWWTVGKLPLTVATVQADEVLNSYLASLGISAVRPAKPDPANMLLVLGPGAKYEGIAAFLESGGRALALNVAEELRTWLPALAQLRVRKQPGEFVWIPPNHPLLSGLTPLDIRWWNGDSDAGPRVCDWTFVGANGNGFEPIAQYLAPHAYLKQRSEVVKFEGVAIFRLTVGRGRLIASSLRLADDPIARRFTANLIRYAAR